MFKVARRAKRSPPIYVRKLRPHIQAGGALQLWQAVRLGENTSSRNPCWQSSLVVHLGEGLQQLALSPGRCCSSVTKGKPITCFSQFLLSSISVVIRKMRFLDFVRVRKRLPHTPQRILLISNCFIAAKKFRMLKKFLANIFYS